MLAAIGDRLAAVFRRSAPVPFVIAVLLTELTFVLVLIFTDAGPRSRRSTPGARTPAC